MNKSHTLLTTAIAALVFGGSSAALAAAPAGKGDVGVGISGSTDRGAAGAAAGVDAGASASAPAASESGQANSNGSMSTDRDLGQDRAAERRSAEGQAHEKATDNTGKRKARMRKPPPPSDGAEAEPVK